MFDLDVQMSLTQAVGLNEDSGSLYPAFGGWYDKSVNGRRTIFDAIDQYTKPAAAHFDFPIAYDFIYQINKGLHFVPSVEDLYWLELEHVPPKLNRWGSMGFTGRLDRRFYWIDSPLGGGRCGGLFC